MDNRKTRLAAAAIAISFGVTAGIHTAEGQQLSCTLDQDEIVALAGDALAPGADLLSASPGQLGDTAGEIAIPHGNCALDIVVALGTIRPDAANEIARGVADAFPGLEGRLLAAGQQLGDDAIEPAAGFDDPYDAPYNDDEDDDDQGEDEDEDDEGDVSPA